MEGLTASEMASKLKIPLKTVKKRLERAGIKPLTQEAVYPENALEIIKNIKMGRPKKAKPE
jgi:predicted ArsR family transcriptional regulator